MFTITRCTERGITKSLFCSEYEESERVNRAETLSGIKHDKTVLDLYMSTAAYLVDAW